MRRQAEERGRPEAAELYRQAARAWASLCSLVAWAPESVEAKRDAIETLETRAREAWAR